MPPRRRRLLLLPLLLAACTGEPLTNVLITLRVENEALRPQHVMLLWRVPGLADRPEQRLPEYGELGKDGPVVGSVSFQVEATIAGERELIATGYRGERKVSGARAKVSWVRGATQQLTLTLGCLPEPQDEAARKACATVDPDHTGAPDAGADSRAEKPDDQGNRAPADAGAGAVMEAALDAAMGGGATTVDAGGPEVERDTEPPPVVSVDAGPVDMRLPAGVELGRNLEIYLRLDEGDRSLNTADGAGKGANAALVSLDVGRAWIPGVRGNGLHFPGDVPGWLRVSGNVLNTLTDNFTFSVWIRSNGGTDAPSNRRTILARRSIGAGGFLYSLHLAGNRPGLYINSSNGANANFVSTQTLPSNKWAHLALVYDRQVARLWLDGRNVGEQVYMLTLPPENSPLCVGASEDPSPGTATDPLGADLDEIAIYDRALSAEEIQALAGGAQPPAR
jgi:hypothetical protein